MDNSQKERLLMLAEEASEISQAVCKILRHGYDNYNPNDLDKKSNKELLVYELEDLLAIIKAMTEAEDIKIDFSDSLLYDEVWKMKLKWTNYQNTGVK